jgi:hypothetical protein
MAQVTIGRHYQGPSRNYTDMCGYCGTFYERTELVLDAEGILDCGCNGGLTPIELSEISAANVGEIEPVKAKTREGP